jgi:dTDP-4-dehydrorhamnose 3,5-epimerase
MPVSVTASPLAEILILEPKVWKDERGFFLESFNERDFFRSTALNPVFIQDNHSRSQKGVLRGLHYQVHQPQGKLVRVVRGQVFDVAVNLQRNHRDFGKWFGTFLSDDNHRQLWIPPGFAHGFITLSEWADVAYKATDYFSPEYERTLLWNDPAIGITWPIDFEPILSAKDLNAPSLNHAELFD